MLKYCINKLTQAKTNFVEVFVNLAANQNIEPQKNYKIIFKNFLVVKFISF